MTPQPSYQTIAIHILPNISRSKGNQTMKLSQLTESNLRTTKCDGGTSPRPFLGKLKLTISLD